MKRLVGVSVIVAAFAFYVSGCRQNEEGHRLAQQYCQSCHKLPEPEWLDKKIWMRYVLPKMGALLGFRRSVNETYFENGNNAMPLESWNKIVAYYIGNAPDTLKREENPAIQMDLKNFSVQLPSFALKEPTTTYVGVLPGQREILFGDALAQKLYRLKDNDRVVDSLNVEQGVVNVKAEGTELKVLSMGVLYPSDEKRGKLTVYDQASGGSYALLDSLQRPVFAEYGDLNNDSLQDIVLCEFGNTVGQLSWFENKGNRHYRKHVLRPLPGAVRTSIIDLNKDGKPDVVALMAQGDEGLFVFYNKGGGQFEEKRLVQLPPSYGSNFFELADFNKDGHPDLLATNGDNGDYPPILKPYHGIRIYLNDGKNNFSESRFLPVNGACKAIARDFDGDGDLDIAAISYFPDYDHRPEESFLFWENTGNFRFLPSSLKEAILGRWLTMEAGDVDGDGDEDILLGNAKFSLGYVPGWLMNKWNTAAPSVLILKNQVRR